MHYAQHSQSSLHVNSLQTRPTDRTVFPYHHYGANSYDLLCLMTSASNKCRPTCPSPRLGRVVDVIHVVLAAWSCLVLLDCLPAIVVFRSDDYERSRLHALCHYYCSLAATRRTCGGPRLHVPIPILPASSSPQYSETYRTMTA